MGYTSLSMCDKQNNHSFPKTMEKENSESCPMLNRIFYLFVCLCIPFPLFIAEIKIMSAVHCGLNSFQNQKRFSLHVFFDMVLCILQIRWVLFFSVVPSCTTYFGCLFRRSCSMKV
ncbi:hypothetical protein HYC85_026573 [Camellia sinensis]|uniref:Uncharacterized protein n=1 Tax=Camellia sinensis TaxID=4442 RepID=A0A7J7G7Y2_CAMSI|nr:hypothetical protein HYC85_026573 [Camellia sinensis]